MDFTFDLPDISDFSDFQVWRRFVILATKRRETKIIADNYCFFLPPLKVDKDTLAAIDNAMGENTASADQVNDYPPSVEGGGGTVVFFFFGGSF